MKITIYGTAQCTKCKQLLSLVEETVKELNISAKIEKVNDPLKAVEKGIMSLPALVVDEDIKLSGRVPLKKEVEEILNV